jgi:EAL domain-containing protein (putative c-di-GMP-specific phosphodiesterase class I)/DNA-binding response OmpR family regulator/GGDEF domain-containing protein
MQMNEQLDYTKHKVFIVDDNPANTMMLKKVVEADDFESIYVYNDPEVALAEFYKIKPQLILLDLVMPKITGLEFLHKIAPEIESADVAVIVLTASHDKARRLKALELGAQDYIEKPINIIETLQRIKNVLNLQQRKTTFQNLSEDLGGRLIKTQKDLSEVIVTLNTIFDHSSEYVFVTDEHGVVTDCNKVAQNRFSIDMEDKCNLFQQFKMDLQLLNAGAPELTLSDVDNRRIIVEVSYSKVEINNVSHYIFILRDITVRKEDEINLKYLAETHYITHLPNRNQTALLLNEKCDTLSPGNHLSFIFLSFFDNNKVVEFYGHERLEYLLLNIVLLLVELADVNDSVLIHWGDNDFLIVEDSCNSEALQQKIVDCFSGSIQISDGSDVGIYSKPTLGICSSGLIENLKSNEYDELVHKALLATFEAARLGQQVAYYDDQLHQKINYQAMIEKELIKALANKGFKVAYQPKVDLKTKKIVSAEALIRWQHPEHGMIRPDIFITIAENCGLINDIGTIVLKQVFSDVVKLKSQFPDMKHVAINVAAPQLNERLIELLKSLCEGQSDNIANFIELEITETSFLDDFDRVLPILKEVKDLGFRLALDDFGTGYSSLSYLHELPVDTLKIDRAFVIPMLESKRSFLLVKSIVSMSLALGLDIVAEGIEDEKTGELLCEMGVQQGQGYYYYKPKFLD